MPYIRWDVEGVTSYGYNGACEDASKRTAFVQVDVFKNWITNTVQGNP